MIGNRIKEARTKKGLSQEALAEKIGISKRTLINYEKNEQEPTVTTIINIAKFCTTDELWLLTGKNENIENINNELHPLKNNTSYEIEVLNVKASAGAGIENHIVEVIDTIILDKNLFKTPINPNKIKLIQVSGDSMFPTLNDGDFVVIDEAKSHGVDGIYAINLHNQILIKRLKFKLDGTIQIISDNKDYEMEIYNPKETQIPLHIIGLKTLTIQR